jgi:hypothetical protein
MNGLRSYLTFYPRKSYWVDIFDLLPQEVLLSGRLGTVDLPLKVTYLYKKANNIF